MGARRDALMRENAGFSGTLTGARGHMDMPNDDDLIGRALGNQSPGASRRGQVA
jgi:hypothetical protein